MRKFGHDLSSIEIIPWFQGTFDVSVGGTLVHSMEREGGFPEHETVLDAVAEALREGSRPPDAVMLQQLQMQVG